jgi:anti-sigma regulatory factor (Ser/Thr protein kinase)
MAYPLLSTTIHAQGDLLALRRMLRARLEQRGCSAGDAQAVILAAHEATMNGLRFSAERPVYVTVHLHLDRAVVCVADSGEGFDHRSQPHGQLPDAERSSGRGLHIIDCLMDRLDVVVQPLGCVVRMEKRIELAAAGD